MSISTNGRSLSMTTAILATSTSFIINLTTAKDTLPNLKKAEILKKALHISQRSKKTNSLKKSKQSSYTSKQIECAEILGIDAEECTPKSNDTTKKEVNLLKQKRSISTAQQSCIDTLNVSEEDCNTHGVYIARTQEVLDEIKDQLENTDTQTWTPDDLKSISSLIIRKKNIERIKEYDFHGLENLRKLDFFKNRISTIPRTIGNLTQLTDINFNTNQIEVLPEELTALTKLKKLSLNQNSLQTIPNSIGNLTLLEELYLGTNHFTELPDEIGYLTRLENLYLGKNQVRKIPITIKNLISLKKLTLNENNLQYIPDEIGDIINLELLRLDNNELETLPTSIKNLINLEKLAVDQNKITKLPNEYKNLQNLTTLWLQNNVIQTIPGEIGSLKKLNILSIFGNPVILTADLFEYQLEFEQGAEILIKDLLKNDTYTPFVKLNNYTIVPLLDVIEPFYELEEFQYGAAELIRIPNVILDDPIPNSLTNHQRAFLCTFLKSALLRSNITSHQTEYKKCINLDTEELTTTYSIPTTLIPTTFITTSLIPSPTITIDKKTTPLLSKTIIYSTSGAIGLLLLSTMTICLCIFLKKHRHKVRSKKINTQINNLLTTKGLNSEEIIKNIDSGEVKLKHVASLENSKTQNKVLQDIALNDPGQLERWIDEGKINIKRDLSNTECTDEHGNTIFHILATHHPKILDNWIEIGKVSPITLSEIKNNEDQSVIQVFHAVNYILKRNPKN